MARKARPQPKLCGRCDSFFPTIASETCPQCFAPLTALTDEEAAKAAGYQLERLKDPEFLEQKFEEDEKFKEQSFGACLGVLAVFLCGIFFSVFLISVAAKHHLRHSPQSSDFAASTSSAPGANLLPVRLGELSREQVGSIPQMGSPNSIVHARYGEGIIIYALPTSGCTPEMLESFRLAVSAIDNQTTPALVSQEVHGKVAYYAIIGANGGLVGDVAQRVVNSQM